MLVIDQSSKSTYAYIFAEKRLCAKTQRKHRTVEAEPGQFEFDPEEIFTNMLLCMADLAKQLVSEGIAPSTVKSCAFALQRESLVVFDTFLDISLCGIGWSDSRCAALLSEMKTHEELLKKETGLPLSTNLTALKYLHWKRENQFKETPDTVVSTIDTFLLYKLLGVLVHEVTMASRTGYFDSANQTYDEELLRTFCIAPQAVSRLRISPSRCDFGRISEGPFKLASVVLVVGDSNAAFLGARGDVISVSMGYGAFILAKSPLRSSFKTVLISDETTAWAFEAKLQATTAVLDWLVQINVLPDIAMIDSFLQRCETSNGVLISAFLQVVTGVTLSVEPQNLVRAALEGIAADVAFVLKDFAGDVRISGGISRNDSFCQILADVCRRNIVREPQMTARGCYKYISGKLTDESSVCTVFTPGSNDYSQLLARWNEIYSIKAARGLFK